LELREEIEQDSEPDLKKIFKTKINPRKNDTEDVSDIIEVAENYFNEGELKKSEKILQQLLIQDTHNPKVYYLLGAIYYDRGKHHRSEIAFKRSLDIDPDFRDASVALTILYNDLGEYEKAEKIYNEARKGVEQEGLGKDPHMIQIFSDKHEQLADLYAEHEYYMEAHKEYENAVHHRPKKIELLIKSAKCLEKTGSTKMAIEKLKDVKSTYPEYIPARLTLGMLYFNTHQIPEAVSEWESVIKREPKNKEAKLYLKVASQTQMTTL